MRAKKTVLQQFSTIWLRELHWCNSSGILYAGNNRENPCSVKCRQRTLEDLKTFGLYPSGNKVTEKPEILFARLDLKEVIEKVEELHPPKEEPKAKEEKKKT